MVVIPDDHPCLPGHFPGRPIVPAVVVLDEVRALIADTYPEQPIRAIDHCKFQDFVLPDRPFRIVLTVSGAGTIGFACYAVDDDRVLANGRVRLEAKEPVV
ncbi:MAG: ACP dehydratase [Geminicoccaceae bacterium]